MIISIYINEVDIEANHFVDTNAKICMGGPQKQSSTDACKNTLLANITEKMLKGPCIHS